jgi:ABC-type lipoprotein export system ATPase subunit
LFLLRRITLDIKEGEFASIMGPSGAGKSALLHILGLYDSDWKGEYILDGNDIHRLKQKKRAEIQKRCVGFVFQSYHLLDHLGVYENLELPLSYRDMKNRREKVWSPISWTDFISLPRKIYTPTSFRVASNNSLL